MFKRIFVGLIFLGLLAAAAAWWALRWWPEQPLPWSEARAHTQVLELEIPSGAGAAQIAQRLHDAGVAVPAELLRLWLRFSGQSHHIRAGHYDIERGMSARVVLDKLVRGQQSLKTITFVEGWTFAQMRTAIAKNPHLKQDIEGLDAATIMRSLGQADLAAEGQFFPDTYAFARGSSALAVLRQAHEAMQRQLQATWALRTPDSPLNTPQELLILASIVEKETGRAADRALIAGVFTNRLRINMPLQTDPTVIYGLGTAFDGNLRRVDLRTDTPWNTYTRRGLPPTPIAMPGRDALMAAIAPEATHALYFVARGDGTSHFSATLAEHNQAVNFYQRGIGAPPQ